MYESLIVNDEDAMRVKGGVAGEMRECQSRYAQHKRVGNKMVMEPSSIIQRRIFRKHLTI